MMYMIIIVSSATLFDMNVNKCFNWINYLLMVCPTLRIHNYSSALVVQTIGGGEVQMTWQSKPLRRNCMNCVTYKKIIAQS
jgi:hypothetical protein